MSKTPLNQFMENEKLNGNCLVLKVVKNLGNGKYIVGDASSLGILLNEMKESK